MDTDRAATFIHGRPAHAVRPRRFLLPTLGSAGDVHPFIALGRALADRGHAVTLLANPLFQKRIEHQRLGFLPIGTREEAEATITDSNLWHRRKGFEVIARCVMIPALKTVYELIQAHADDDTVVAASSLALGARVAQEKLGIPTASIHLQPAVVRSEIDHGRSGNLRIAARHPLWFKRLFFRLADWLVIDRVLAPPLNAFRGSLGLPPVRRVMQRWVHSPELVIGLFPDWFARPQSDWPPNTHLVGFPLWDGADLLRAPAEIEQFLAAGPPPLIFTAGSAAATQPQFFRESIDVAARLRRRAILVTDFPQQLPAALPEDIVTSRYLPFSEILPRAALFVHHGGIGTIAQTIKAGIPQLIVPKAHDQFDNGWRIEQLGLGRSIPQTRHREQRVAAAIDALLADESLRVRCRQSASRIDSNAAVTSAGMLLESMESPTANHTIR